MFAVLPPPHHQGRGQRRFLKRHFSCFYFKVADEHQPLEITNSKHSPTNGREGERERGASSCFCGNVDPAAPFLTSRRGGKPRGTRSGLSARRPRQGRPGPGREGRSGWPATGCESREERPSQAPGGSQQPRQAPSGQHPPPRRTVCTTSCRTLEVGGWCFQRGHWDSRQPHPQQDKSPRPAPPLLVISDLFLLVILIILFFLLVVFIVPSGGLPLGLCPRRGGGAAAAVLLPLGGAALLLLSAPLAPRLLAGTLLLRLLGALGGGILGGGWVGGRSRHCTLTPGTAHRLTGPAALPASPTGASVFREPHSRSSPPGEAAGLPPCLSPDSRLRQLSE